VRDVCSYQPSRSDHEPSSRFFNIPWLAWKRTERVTRLTEHASAIWLDRSVAAA